MIDKALQSFAQEIGLKYDEPTATVFGYYSGYHVCLMPNPGNRSIFNILFSVTRAGTMPGKTDFKPLVKSCRMISNCLVQNGSVTVVSKPNGWSRKKSLQNAKTALEEAVAFLHQNGYTDCCQRCGQDTATDTYLVNGQYMHLCPTCFGAMSAQSSQQQFQEAQKAENVIGGIVGAFLGSLLGVLVMVILDQLGYVAALSGIVLAVCTLKGYEMLGGKLTRKGTVISIIVMLVMVYVGNRITWAIAASSQLKGYLDMNIFEYFRYLPDLLDMAEAQSEYFGSLALQYLFAALGAVPSVIAAGKNKKFKRTIHQLGRE